MLRSDLCDFSHAYIVVKGNIAVTEADNAKRNKSVSFKNNTQFIICISKINGAQIDNAEDLNVVMPMYNLLEYNKNYRQTTEVLIILVLVKLIMTETKLVKMKMNLLLR